MGWGGERLGTKGEGREESKVAEAEEVEEEVEVGKVKVFSPVLEFL